MFTHDTQLRVRYGETDQMGYAYYGHYAQYFEVGRVEALRSLGFPYRKLEEQGVMLPVRSLSITYHAPARYDDPITVRTTIAEMPTARIRFTYHIYNEQGVLLTEAETVLVFVDKATMRPRKAPSDFLEAMSAYFK
jgi:acyl-CoA thioester hydrolase